MHREADRTPFEELPKDSKERHEKIMHFVGQDIMDRKQNAMTSVFRHLDGTNPGTGLLPYDAKFFEEAAAKLDPEQREIAKKLCSRVLTDFMESFMTMISCHGHNNRLGSEHGLQYHLTVDVCHYPKPRDGGVLTERELAVLEDEESDDPIKSFVPVEGAGTDETTSKEAYGRVCESHDLGHGGQLHFPHYWHRWMSKFKAH